MKRLGLTLVVGALALGGGCKKKESEGATGKGTGSAEGTAAGTGAGTTAGTAAAAPDPKLLERGKYVATLAGCPLCHTPVDMAAMRPDMTKMFAGGLEVKEAFGTWRAPNITPDPETGIGKWTEAQIIAAVREGKRPDGTMVKAVMPYMFYAGMTDDDAKALAAFLKSIPPVVNKVEPLPLPLPDIPAPQVPRVDPVDDPVKHGQYLASLMHCGACHTPMGPQGPDLSKMYAGGMPMEMPPPFGTGVLYSSNITSDAETGIGAWTEEDIIKAVKMTVRPDNRPIFGPMMWYVPLWSQLTDADAAALATYIKSIPPIANKVPASTFKPAAPPEGAGGPPPPPAGGGPVPPAGEAKPM